MYFSAMTDHGERFREAYCSIRRQHSATASTTSPSYYVIGIGGLVVIFIEYSGYAFAVGNHYVGYFEIFQNCRHDPCYACHP